MICANCDQETNYTITMPKEDTRISSSLWLKGVCEDCYLDVHPDAKVSHECVECGDRVRVGAWCNEEELKFFGLCLQCDHWVGLLYPECRSVVTKDHQGLHHYQIGEEPTDRHQPFLGFGGSEMVIDFFVGEQVISHNLWHQGTIPVHFHDRFQANAYINGVRHGGEPVGPDIDSFDDIP